jgi:DNA-binding response OmpR family regulator
MKILIVEDDNMMRRILKRAAMAVGHEATGCADAERALEMLKEESYPIVILDWMLPGMDGIELCRKIRGMPGGEHFFILMVTAKDRYEDLVEVLGAGADDYIAKPVDVKTLKTRITVAERMFRRLEELRGK